MRIQLFGHGKMGKMVEKLALEQGHSIVSDTPDAYIDFSHASVVLNHVEQASAMQRPIVIGTTGWEEQLPHIKHLVEEHGIAALYAPNFSIGVALFGRLLKEARSLFVDYEAAGIEVHHSEKKDAPSGTAKHLANLIGISPFSSVRCGTITGTHQVIFDSPIDSITLTHTAKSREGYALGAIQAAEWIKHKKGWLTLDDMLDSLNYALH